MIKSLSQSSYMRITLAAFLAAGVALMAHAAPPPSEGPGMTATEMPKEFKDVGIQEKLSTTPDPSLLFKNEKGETVTLGSFYDGEHPVVISPIYYSCPGLCNFHLNGVIDSIKNIDWTVGKQFKYVVVSFDSTETPELARQKKETYLKSYGRPESADGWHFLTADAETIQKLTQQLGFSFKWNEETKEWAHASAAIVTTPDGKISRYLHGIIFDEKNFKLALSEATQGKIGNLVDRMIWYCFKYDPHQSKYTIYAANIMKAGGVVIILVLTAVILPVWIRSRREQV